MKWLKKIIGNWWGFTASSIAIFGVTGLGGLVGFIKNIISIWELGFLIFIFLLVDFIIWDWRKNFKNTPKPTKKSLNQQPTKKSLNQHYLKKPLPFSCDKCKKVNVSIAYLSFNSWEFHQDENRNTGIMTSWIVCPHCNWSDFKEFTSITYMRP